MTLEVPLLAPVDDTVQQPTPTPLTTAIRDSFDDERTDFVNSLKTVATIAPAEYGKANATARMSGIPAATLYEQRERMAELEKGNKYAAIYDTSRKTANALRDGNLAAVAQNDLDALTRIEGAASDTRFNEQSLGEKMLGAIQQQWTSQAQGTNLSDARDLQRIGASFDAVDAEIARATTAGEQPFLETGGPSGFAGEYLRSTPEQRQVMRENLNSQQGEFIGRVGEQQKELESAPVDPAAREIQQLQASNQIGIPLGGLERQVIDTGEGMSSFDATIEALTPGFAGRTALGAAVSSAPALLAGAVGGIPLASAINFGTEFDVKLADVIREAGVDFNDPAAVMKALQDDELMQTASDKAALKAAGTTAVDALGMMFAGKLLAPTRIAGRPLSETQRELANLAVQFPVQGISEAAGEAAGQLAAEGKVDAGDVLLEGIAGGLGSSADVMAFGGKRMFTTLADGLSKSRQARVGQQSLSAAAAASVESETRKLDPGTFNQIATQQLADTPLETLWIPAEELQRLNQSGAIDLPAILAQVPGLTEQFGDALVRGGNVAMKGADYLTYLADFDEQLSKSIRTSAGNFSAEDAQAWSDQQEEQLTQLAEEFRKGPDVRAQAQQDFVGQLVQAGFRRADAEQYAALHSSVLNNLAERNALGLDQLEQQFPLDIRNKAPEDLRRVTVDDATLLIQRLRAGDIPQAGDIFGKSLGEYLRDAGGVNDAGGELAALDADVGKVGRNRLTRKDGGMSLDDAAMNAWERGYFPGVKREDVTPQLITDAVRDEMAGNPRYSAEQENPNKADTADTLNQLQEYFDRLGVNLSELSDQEALAILRNPQAAEAGDVQQLEQGGNDDDARGYISFSPRGQSNRKFNITLSDKRDLSTLVHELGHYYLEVIQDLAQAKDAPQQIKDDVAAIRGWVGADGDAPLTTEQHEQFARGFEAYLAEGKAPAPELNGAFARFKRWMLAIYKHLSRLNVALNDDVRKVFDRIVASDDQIQDAERVSAALPLFKDAEAAGMTETEFAQYQNSIELAHTDARDSVEEQITREETRRQSKWWNEQLANIRIEVAEEVDLQPEYVARNALRSGKNPNGSAGEFKLNSAELADRYGKPGTQKLAFMHSKTGLSLDLAANILGFESGDDMVKAMMGAQPRKAVIEAEALRRMEERHGPKQTGEIAERAMDAVHNERRAEVLGKELRRLAQVGNRKNVTSQQILKEAAARVMSERKVRDIQPIEYQRAEAKASRQAFEAFTKGDLDAAYEAKQRQLLNFYLYREAAKARAEVETITDRLNGYNNTKKRQKIGKAGGDYLDQIDAVMEQYEFRNISLRKIDGMKSFNQWYNDQISAGNDPYVPEFVLNTQRKTNYKELSLAQLQELDEFVAHLNHKARQEGKLQANKRISDQKEAQELLIQAMVTNLNKGKPLPLNDSMRTLPEAMGDWLSEANSSLMKLEQIIDQADGGDPNGAWSQIWWQPLADAQARRDDLNREITEKILTATDAWFAAAGSRAGQKVKINNLGKSIDYNGILAVALNSGNAGNLKKMLDGNGWTDAAHAEILSHMREEDWRYVTTLWEIVNSLWPDIVALEKQVNGIAPEKVEGLQVQTQFGVVQGAYWPLVYDFLSPEFAKVQANLGELSPLNEQGGARATTPRGHTKARVDGFAAPVVLDVTVIANHLSGVIHDLTHRVAIADARKLITAPTVRQVMNERMGRFQAQQFINILDGITNDLSPGSAKGVGIFRRTMNALRGNAAIAWMGYSVTTMFNQIGGASQALEYFAQKGQRKHYMRAVAKFAMNPIATRAEVLSLSGEMRNRSINLDPSIREATNRIIRVGEGRIGTAFNDVKNAHDAIKRWAFVPMATMQSVVDTPVWMGAYEAEGGVNSGNGGKDAIDAADRAVRLTQMAGGAKDLAPIQHNELARFFLLVYGYASLLWNRNVDIARSGTQAIKEKDVQGTLVALERFVYLNIIPSVLAGAIKGALPDDDDRDKDKMGDTWPEYIAIQTLLSVTNGVPLARDAAQGFFSDFGYGGATPIGGGIDALIKATNSTKTEALVTNMTTATGMLIGLPSSQINRATRTFFQVSEGEMESDAFTIAKSVLFGPPPKKD